MSRVLFLVVALLMCCLASTAVPAGAQESGGTYNEELPQVLVRGEGLVRQELESTSSKVLTNQDVTNRVYLTPADMVTQVPGMSVLNYMEGGIPTMIHLRGFSGSHTGGMAFYLDGTQLNEPTGGADTNIVNFIEIDHVDVVKGPVSAVYGNYAQGGTIAYYTIKSGDLQRLYLRAGSYRTLEGAGLLGKTGSLVDQVYAFYIYHTDGYRNNSDWDKYNLSGRWTIHPGDKFTATLGLRAYSSEWNSAGYTPLGWGPKASIDDGSGTYSGGKRTYYSIHLDSNYAINDENTILFNMFFNQRETIRFFPDYVVTNTIGVVPFGSGSFTDLNVWGIAASYMFDGTVGGRKFMFETGVEYVNEWTHARSYRTKWGTGRTLYERSGDNTYDREIISFFAEGNYQLLEPLMVRLGARYDSASGSINNWQQRFFGAAGNYLPNGDPVITVRDSRTRTAFSPKFGLLYTPIERLEIFANASRGFAFPGASGVFYTDPNQTNTIRDQYEIGFRSMPYDWLEGGIAYYRFYTSNDLRTDPTDRTRQINIGESLRTGIENYVDIYPAENWRVHLDYTYQTAVTLKPNAVDNERRITEVPRHITNIEVTYDPPIGFGGRIKYNWNADILFSDYTARFGYLKAQDYGRLDIQLNYKFDDVYQVSLDVLNVLDKQYYGILGDWNTAYNGLTGSYQNRIAAYMTFSANWK